MRLIRVGPMRLIGLLLLICLVSAQSANALQLKYNMSYIYFGSSSNYTQLVAQTQNSMNEVSPAYFSLKSDGNLLLTSAVSSDFIKQMHDAGILVVPFLTNDWDYEKGVAALNNRFQLAQDIEKAVTALNLDGVNIDIENVTHNEREAYVDFVRLLRKYLPNKLITVSVAANPWGLQKDWQGSYDYAGLAQYCDYLMIMAYDESYYGSAPGPVAGISFIERSIKYALSVVPKEQLVIGLPFYGRIWSSAGGFPYGYGISINRIEKLIEDYDGKVRWDSSSASACATIIVKSTDTKPIVNGKALGPGTYVIWYSDERSIKETLSLVTKYDIKGAGSWSLGQEPADTWNYYSLWLNGCRFSDIQNNWAKDAIFDTFMKGWMQGITSERFSPVSALTRGQAAAVLLRMFEIPPVQEAGNGFADSKDHWAEAYITTARKYNIVSGIGNNLYEPDRAVTREELVVMLNNILRLNSSGYTAFSDVTEAENAWSYQAITALAEAKIIGGYPDGSFGAKNPVSRAEAAAVFSRAADFALT